MIVRYDSQTWRSDMTVRHDSQTRQSDKILGHDTQIRYTGSQTLYLIITYWTHSENEYQKKSIKLSQWPIKNIVTTGAGVILARWWDELARRVTATISVL